VKQPRESGDPPPRLRRGPTVGIVSEPETIFTAALSGLPGNKASIDPPNEPTQQSLLLDLYLLKSGERKAALSAHSIAFVGLLIVLPELCASSGMPGI